MKPCILIPHFRHERQLPAVIGNVLPLGLPVIVVDDGSPEDSYASVRSSLAPYPEVQLERISPNRGKGAAVTHGLRMARSRGFTHAVQVDADGQHDIARIPAMLEALERQPDALVSGCPVFDDSVPRARLKGRQFSILWVHIHTWSRDIVDPMCGLRVYPVERTLRLVSGRGLWMRMEFDLEILVRAHWRGIPLVFLPVRVIYPEGGHSNFRLVGDNVRISLMHTRLFFGMLLRSPLLLWRMLGRTEIS
jgi:glycosyltransferase involved in cell wall biosynthesis